MLENGKLISKEIQIETTTKCSANCVMCPRAEYNATKMGRTERCMSSHLFETTVDQAVRLGATSLDLSGFGDVFCDDDLHRRLIYCSKMYPQLRIYTSTTGQLMDEERRRWLGLHVHTLRISHYGIDAQTFNSVHRGCDYDTVCANIMALLDQRPRPWVAMSYLMLPDVPEQYKDAWLDRWLGVADEVFVWKPHNYGGLADKYAWRAPGYGGEARSCGRPMRGTPYVHANGDVTVCCYAAAHQKDLILGNVATDDLRHILSGPRASELISEHSTGNFCESCAKCDQIYSREGALVYASGEGREIDMATSHPDHLNKLR